jgi:5S rRNA maturation endonuclease (ribonuclease M5)
MRDRVVVPVYDEDGKRCVVCTARSIYDRCCECRGYHDPTGPCYKKPKWIHKKIKQDKIGSGSLLYGIWHTKPHIIDNRSIILVESTGNVWRLWEAGLRNCAAIFGCDLQPPQRAIIDRLNIDTVHILMDNDDAGKKAAAKLDKSLSSVYNTNIVNCSPFNDVGDMDTTQVINIIKPQVRP